MGTHCEFLINRQFTSMMSRLLIGSVGNRAISMSIHSSPPDQSVLQKIIFLISQPKHMLWVLIRTVSMRRSLEHPKHMFKLMGKKIITIIRILFA